MEVYEIIDEPTFQVEQCDLALCGAAAAWVTKETTFVLWNTGREWPSCSGIKQTKQPKQ